MERFTHALNLIKSNWLAINMAIGLIGYKYFCPFKFILPYLIFAMLFLTFLFIDVKKIKWERWFGFITSIQWVCGFGLYFAIRNLLRCFCVPPLESEVMSQGVAICTLMPTASASPIVCRKIGGDVYKTTSFMILSNVVGALLLPLFFTIARTTHKVDFFDTMLLIFQRTAIVLLAPLFLACIVRKIILFLHKNTLGLKKYKRVEKKIANVPFYIWGFTIIILTAEMTNTLLEGRYVFPVIVFLGIAAIIVCSLQFEIGKRIGQQYDLDDQSISIATCQSMGQKNTTLGIWLSQIYLLPYAFIAPACYMISQNIINNKKIKKFSENSQKILKK